MRPVYAPALVAFVGGPALWRGRCGGRRRWYGSLVPAGSERSVSPRLSCAMADVYVRQINVVHVTDVTVIEIRVDVVNVHYANQAVPGAVMAVPHEGLCKVRVR